MIEREYGLSPGEMHFVKSEAIRGERIFEEFREALAA
jgi:hypothetical protein